MIVHALQGSSQDLQFPPKGSGGKTRRNPQLGDTAGYIFIDHEALVFLRGSPTRAPLPRKSGPTRARSAADPSSAARRSHKVKTPAAHERSRTEEPCSDARSTTNNVRRGRHCFVPDSSSPFSGRVPLISRNFQLSLRLCQLQMFLPITRPMPALKVRPANTPGKTSDDPTAEPRASIARCTDLSVYGRDTPLRSCDGSGRRIGPG